MEDATAWLLAAIALFVLLLAIWGAAVVYADALDQSRLEHGQRTQVEAVLLDEPPPSYREANSDGLGLRSVRFTGTSGSEHVADVPLAGRQPAGGTVQLWVDRNDRVMPPPLTRTDAVVIGATAGMFITALGAAVLASLWCGLRRLLDVCNSLAWDREWSRVRNIPGVLRRTCRPKISATYRPAARPGGSAVGRVLGGGPGARPARAPACWCR